jgi:predicted Zn-dependent protease
MVANIALLGLAVASGGRGGATTMRLSSIAAGLIENGFSREQERESDYLGVDYMVRAGYDPRGAIDLQEFFFEKFEKGKDPLWIEGLFRTHPFSAERLQNIRNYVSGKYSSALGSPSYRISEGRYLDRIERLRKVQKAYDVYDEGVKLLKEKKRRSALEKFQRAIEMEPRQAPFYSKAGLVFLLDDELGSAITYLNKAVKIDPEFAEARIYLGISLYERRRYRKAVVQLEKSMDLMPTKLAARYLGKCYRKLGDSEKAAKYEKMSR